MAFESKNITTSTSDVNNNNDIGSASITNDEPLKIPIPHTKALELKQYNILYIPYEHEISIRKDGW